MPQNNLIWWIVGILVAIVAIIWIIKNVGVNDDALGAMLGFLGSE